MKCKTKKEPKCPNMIFDELWGEWKCLSLQIRIYGSDICKECIKCAMRKQSKEKKKAKKCKNR